MPKKKRFYKEPENTILVMSYVTEVIESNCEHGDKVKNVFNCLSYTGKPKMCIYWGRSNVAVGDKVHLKGWYSPNGVFIAKEVMIMPKSPQEEAALTDEKEVYG